MLQPLIQPETAGGEEQDARQNAGHHDWFRQRVDTLHQRTLFFGHVFFCGIEKELVVLVALQQIAPNDQCQKYSGDDPPGDQRVKDGSRER